MAAIRAAGLAGIAPVGGVLAAELDPARPAYSLPVLSIVARLHPGGGRAGRLAQWRVIVDALAPGLSPALCPVRAGVVAVRSHQ